MDNHEPKSEHLFDSMKESHKEFKYALTRCRKSKEEDQANLMARASQDHSPKNSGKISEKQKGTMAPTYSGRCNWKDSSQSDGKKTFCSTTERKKLCQWYVCEAKYNKERNSH